MITGSGMLIAFLLGMVCARIIRLLAQPTIFLR